MLDVESQVLVDLAEDIEMEEAIMDKRNDDEDDEDDDDDDNREEGSINPCDTMAPNGSEFSHGV